MKKVGILGNLWSRLQSLPLTPEITTTILEIMTKEGSMNTEGLPSTIVKTQFRGVRAQRATAMKSIRRTSIIDPKRDMTTIGPKAEMSIGEITTIKEETDLM